MIDLQITNTEYEQYRPLLFSIGYRMLGLVGEAEDLVQDTFLKAYQMDEQQLNNKKAYLCKIMTNRCLDVLKSSRHKRQQYIGPWNPEPLLQEQLSELTPPEIVIQKEGLSIAYLRMMEHLTPDERAIFLLREAFNFSYLELSSILEKKEENCRKIFSRAKQKLAAIQNESLNYDVNKSVIDRFVQAFQTQRMDALLELISEKVVLYSDGGGIVRAAIRPIESRSNVLAFLVGILKKAPDDYYFKLKNVNGQPAIINFFNNNVHSIFSFYIANETIEEIYITMNPEKLIRTKDKLILKS